MSQQSRKYHGPEFKCKGYPDCLDCKHRIDNIGYMDRNGNYPVGFFGSFDHERYITNSKEYKDMVTKIGIDMELLNKDGSLKEE